jgi:hypothetical protein
VIGAVIVLHLWLFFQIDFETGSTNQERSCDGDMDGTLLRAQS